MSICCGDINLDKTLETEPRESIERIFKVLVPSFIVILSVPLVDLIVSGGRGQHISYLFPNAAHHLYYYYFTFFGAASGISFGMRFEIFMVLGWSWVYLRAKQINIFKAVWGLLLIYSAIFFAIATPYVIQILNMTLQVNMQPIGYMVVNYFLLLLLPLGTVIGSRFQIISATNCKKLYACK